MKANVSEISEQVLDWLVSKCEDDYHFRCYEGRVKPEYAGAVFYRLCWSGSGAEHMRYSTDWSQGGPIIERECIDLECDEFYGEADERRWQASMVHHGEGFDAHGSTPLVAAMRCYVASLLGDEVEVPNELATTMKTTQQTS